MLFLSFVDTAVKVNMYKQNAGGGPANHVKRGVEAQESSRWVYAPGTF